MTEVDALFINQLTERVLVLDHFKKLMGNSRSVLQRAGGNNKSVLMESIDKPN